MAETEAARPHVNLELHQQLQKGMGFLHTPKNFSKKLLQVCIWFFSRAFRPDTQREKKSIELISSCEGASRGTTGTRCFGGPSTGPGTRA